MLCYNCAQEVISGSNFCHKCGSKVGDTSGDTKNKFVADQTKQGAGDKPRVKPLVQSALTFDDYRKRKEVSRSSHFKSKKKKDEMTKITVGVMGVEKGQLKSKRGKRLPVVVSVNATANAIIQAAVGKHHNHDRKFFVPKGPEDFALLYPDGTEVKVIPGKQTEFKLCDYKDDLGKSYRRIILFICRKTDLLLACIPTKISESDESDSVDEESEKEASNESSLPVSEDAIHGNNTMNANNTSRPCGEKPSTSAIGVQCPTCFKYFTSGEIAQHADQCVDECVEFMAFDDDVAQVIDSDRETPVSSPNPDDCQPSGLKQQIKNEIGSLATSYVSADKVRLSVRRKHIWDDLRKATKKRIGPTSNLKIIFLGEPAIDDGGPKREFFSGES